MIKKRKFNKKPLFSILALFGLVTIGSTFAYLYSEVFIPNKFKAMTYNVAVEEIFYDDWGTKEVSFVNKDEDGIPVVLRINYNEEWRNTIDGVKVSLDNNVNGVNVVTKNWTNDFTNNFTIGNDGWYYYNSLLNPEDSVKVLNSIALNEQLILTSPYYQDYHDYDYELSFNYEAIQADEDAISEIWGYDATINGNEVLWDI